ncbi:hypothetical protein TRFO_08474 [Tritrichomonas foetus]|uniref:Uncharacterized protein n=1 Tax=Tritrichomonas foetus TaxID=1144522 RepID=A0A1J4JNY1_9EUKA|nr:hypothetical protein TRFO_08474 [Tritrichomonas foetus]|eukprot:OHS99229.1 hypothetical protein TRFO_08474 [Tritrichomonas foetus]
MNYQRHKGPALAAANVAFTPMTHKVTKAPETPYMPLKVDDLDTPVKLNKSHSSSEHVDLQSQKRLFSKNQPEQNQNSELLQLKQLLLKAVKRIDEITSKVYVDAETQTATKYDDKERQNDRISNKYDNFAKNDKYNKKEKFNKYELGNNNKCEKYDKNYNIENKYDINKFEQKDKFNKYDKYNKFEKKEQITENRYQYKLEETEATINDGSINIESIRNPGNKTPIVQKFKFSNMNENFNDNMNFNNYDDDDEEVVIEKNDRSIDDSPIKPRSEKNSISINVDNYNFNADNSEELFVRMANLSAFLRKVENDFDRINSITINYDK